MGWDKLQIWDTELRAATPSAMTDRLWWRLAIGCSNAHAWEEERFLPTLCETYCLLSFTEMVLYSKSHCCSCMKFIRPAKLCQVKFHSLQRVWKFGPDTAHHTSASQNLPLKHPGVKIPSIWQHLNLTVYSNFAVWRSANAQKGLCYATLEQNNQSEANCFTPLNFVLGSAVLAM